jgi:putative transposase
VGIAGIVAGPNTSKQAAEHRVFPYLLRHITASYPNHVWGIDTLAPAKVQVSLT